MSWFERACIGTNDAGRGIPVREASTGIFVGVNVDNGALGAMNPALVAIREEMEYVADTLVEAEECHACGGLMAAGTAVLRHLPGRAWSFGPLPVNAGHFWHLDGQAEEVNQA